MTKKSAPGGFEKQAKALESSVSIPTGKTLACLFDLSLDMLCVADINTAYFKIINNAFERTLGYTKGEILGQSFLDFVHPDDRSATMGALERLANGEPVAHFENRYRCRDGSYKWLAWTSMPVPEEGLTYAVARDVTQHKVEDEALAESEQRFHTIFDSAEDGILVADKQSRKFIIVNKAIAEMLGYEVDELTNLGVADIHPEKSLKMVLAEFDCLAESGGGKTNDIWVKRKDGSQFIADISCFTVNINGRDCLGGIFRDVTERKMLEEVLADSQRKLEERILARTNELSNARMLLQTLIDALPDVVYLKDINFRNLAVNRAFNGFFGLKEGEALGKTNKDLLPPFLYEHCHNDDENVMRSGKPIIAEEERFETEEAKEIFLETTKVPLHDEDGNIWGLVGITRDITDRKIAEQELVAAKQMAEYASKAKSEFLSRMSHELRTPLNAIIGFSHLLQLEENLLGEEQREAIKYISDAGEHLLFLINEVLDISRIEAGEMRLSIEAVSVKQILGATLALTESMVAKKGITIKGLEEGAPWVQADARRLKQVMLNLISNAIKYNHKGGTVSIDCVTTAKGVVRVTISDAGIGIKQQDQAEVFEPFHRVVFRGENIEGTGIGLSITKKLVEAMGGQMGFDSEYGVGSTFWFELPQATADKGEAVNKQSNRDVRPVAGSMKILYVEDNPTSVNVMQGILKRLSDCELICAVDAEKGLNIARTERPDLILMDIDLPGMDGFEAHEVLQNDSRTSDIPVIAVSAHAMPEHIEKGLEAGFADYVVKPIKIQELTDAIGKVCNK
jgi:PAS domain S-box-containing protein